MVELLLGVLLVRVDFVVHVRVLHSRQKLLLRLLHENVWNKECEKFEFMFGDLDLVAKRRFVEFMK
jgi:hypothetical protein